MAPEISNDSEFSHHEPCPHCKSSDALARYTSGWAFCYSCGSKISPTEGEASAVAHHHNKSSDHKAPTPQGLLSGESQAISSRGLSEKTCQKFKYVVGLHPTTGQMVQIANYTDAAGKPVAQKIRGRDKSFHVRGDLKAALPLWGQQLWAEGGKRIVVTEGEIDAMSVSEAQNNKWPVVSLPCGAGSAKKALAAALEYLETFDSVVLCFDNDDPGRDAVADVAHLFKPGKLLIAQLPLKDANEMLKAGRRQELIDCLWNASPYRPDGIVAGVDLWEQLDLNSHEPLVESIPYPWPAINELAGGGIRKGELVVLAAGTGIGKSAVCRELAHWLLTEHKQTVGYVALEESVKKTALGLLSIELNRPLHLTREGIDEATFRKAFNTTVGSGRFYLYDHFGSLRVDSLMSKLRFLAVGCECDCIVLDHLSIVVSGLGDGDERKLIDRAMTEIRSLVEATGISVILVSHLKRPPQGEAHEEGGQTSLGQLRGSAAIGQLSDIVIGLERNQQASEGHERDVTTLRILKNRFCGLTGKAGKLKYEHDTGRLRAYDEAFFESVAGTTEAPDDGTATSSDF